MKRSWCLLAAVSSAALLMVSRAAAEDRRFALSVFHFNIQYVAGGLTGFLTTGAPDPSIDLSAEEVEDRIVVESFEPVLDMFIRHPNWGGDLEMQGYMVEVMAERHPAVLEKLRMLAQSGQVDVVSFHFSDQLFLGYPKSDWQWSARHTRSVFEANELPLSTTVFCQEGQSGPGIATAMEQEGYSTFVFAKNLYGFQHAEPSAPLYRWGDGLMLTYEGRSFAIGDDTVDVRFWFVDDGELFATDDQNPYFPELFVHRPEVVAKREAELTALEEDGYRITTVRRYVDDIKDEVEIATPPPLLDGTWQPNSTDGIKRWMGGNGLWLVDERDNDVRTLGAIAHREILVAETIANLSGIDAQAEIATAFRLLALGQVTDASGINPFRGEIEYGTAHLTEALRLARGVIHRGKSALSADVVGINSRKQSIDFESPKLAAMPEVVAPLDVEVVSGDRTVQTIWREVSPGHYTVQLDFGPGDGRTVSVRFPGDAEDIVYTPGLADDPVSIPRSAFDFEHHDLALCDGLIGLYPDAFLIKDQAMVHLSARIFRDSGDVLFQDDTIPQDESARWVLHYFEGTRDEAFELADRINVRPTLWR